MTKNEKKSTGDKKKKADNRWSEIEFRPWLIRGVILTVLIFAFVLWRLYPIMGNTAFLYAFGLAGLIMGWTIFSYYLLTR